MSLDGRDRLLLLDTFLADAGPRLDRIESGLDEGLAGAELAREAHTLVGAAAVVGLSHVRDLSRELEAALGAGRSDRSRRYVSELRRSLAGRAGVRRVLAVEDDPTNGLLLERVAAREPGVELVLAASGERGIELARELRPDVILLDLRLPDMEGVEVLRRLRENAATEAIPVIVVSADAASDRADELLRAGAAGYLTKPVDVSDVRLLMREEPRRS